MEVVAFDIVLAGEEGFGGEAEAFDRDGPRCLPGPGVDGNVILTLRAFNQF